MVFAHRALFLDMIFPKEVTRVISLDCDQIIREDIKELWDLDLLGNPHGFVPFCEGNREMEDLHFWTHG